MELSISTGLYYTKDYEEILDLIAQTDCKNIELFLNQAFMDVPINKLEKALSVRNLEVSIIHNPLEFLVFPKGETEDFWLSKSISMAKKLGAKLIVSHMVFDKVDEERMAIDDIHKQNIEKYSNTEDIFITTENLPSPEVDTFLRKYDELHDYLVQQDLPMTFDTTHCAVANRCIIETYLKFKKHVKNIHLSDFADGAEHKILGTGELPIAEFLQTLVQDNYEGLLTLEYDFDNSARNDIKTFDEAAKALVESVNFVKRCI